MISVMILINGKPIMGRSAVNRMKIKGTKNCLYDCDDGTKIVHNPDDGAVRLAIEMLKTINE